MSASSCPSCRKQNLPHANFCAACGARLLPAYLPQPEQLLAAAPYGLAAAEAVSQQAKPKKIRPSGKRILILLAVAIGIGLGISELFYLQWHHDAQEPERQAQAMLAAEQKVKFGLLIMSIVPSSPAGRSGLRPHDIITSYGGLAVRDITSYVAAAEAQQPGRDATLTVWRDDREIKLTAPPGYLGFQYEDWNPVRNKIYEGLSSRNYAGAVQLAATAERDGSLTQVQSLIVKILLIPNRSSAQKEKERSELLNALFSVYPMFHVNSLGLYEFYALKSYAAAARCFEEQLKRYDPEDVNVRLNLGLCYASLFDFDNADRHVHYVVDRPNRLTPHGYVVVRTILGDIASGRGNKREALRLFSQNMDNGDDYSGFMCLLAAAKLGDLDQFSEMRGRAERVLGPTFTRSTFYVDALQACALSANGRNSDAVALAGKWGTPKCVVETAAAYWNDMPGGADVAVRLEAMYSERRVTPASSSPGRREARSSD